MTADAGWFDLAYVSADGQQVRDRALVIRELPPAAAIRTRRLRLSGGTEVWQLRVERPVADGPAEGRSDQAAAYQRLDNEILAGLRLHRLIRRAGVAHPPQLSRLHGYEADSALPFALLLPWSGDTTSTLARQLLPAEQYKFRVSLLKGLRWLAVAGIAHRGISPQAVRWDGERQEAQITDFSLATVVGVPRAVVGVKPWAGPEQRRGQCAGEVSDRDDLWGAGQLLYYVFTGEELAGREDLRSARGMADLIGSFLDPPHARPDARTALADIGVPDPVPEAVDDDPLDAGRERFILARAAKAARPTATSSATAPTGEGPPEAAPAGKAPPRPRRWRGRAVVAVSGLLFALVALGLLAGLIR